MKFTTLCPNVFYTDINVGLKLFIDCLEFRIKYNDLAGAQPFCAIEKDTLAVHLIQSKEFAEKDRPEIRLVTPDIGEVYARISVTHPELLHPNLNKVTPRPWGAKEFALRDESNVCIVIQQWT